MALNGPLEVKAKIQIQKSAYEVYEAIVDPERMSGYFISHGSARMETGATVQWRFAEVEGEFPVKVKQARQDEMISFYWDNDKRETFVLIRLEPVSGTETIVSITEGTMPADEAGLKWILSNTEGWANFLACLKAYLEYDINLRKGAFDFMIKK